MSNWVINKVSFQYFIEVKEIVVLFNLKSYLCELITYLVKH